MNPRIIGDIANLPARKRPNDGFPTTVGLEIHPPEREVLHHLPTQHPDVADAVVETQAVVDLPARVCALQVFRWVVLWGFRLPVATPA